MHEIFPPTPGTPLPWAPPNCPDISQPPPSLRCGGCKELGHTQRFCPRYSKLVKTPEVCCRCLSPKHRANNCSFSGAICTQCRDNNLGKLAFGHLRFSLPKIFLVNTTLSGKFMLSQIQPFALKLPACCLFTASPSGITNGNFLIYSFVSVLCKNH